MSAHSRYRSTALSLRLYVWKSLKPVADVQSTSHLDFSEIAIVVAAFLICLLGVVCLRHATARSLCRTMLLLVCAAAAIAETDRTDEFIKAEMQRQRIPGLSLVVLRDGKIVKAAGYGVANRKLQTPATPETVYKIASVSKQFIATGIMLLVQENQIGLDEPLRKYLAETPATWGAITIRHLLTHTSGLGREAPGFNPFKVQSDADVIKSAFPLQLRLTPGEKWEYSNVGYYTLAEVIRKVSGRPWTEYLSDKVFRPSSMMTTHPTNTKVSIPDLAQGYVDNEKLLDADNWLALRPSGAFFSTVLDLAKWDALLYTDRILTDATRSALSSLISPL